MSICHFPSPNQSTNFSQETEQEPEIRTAARICSDVHCFIPKDRRIRDRYPIADIAIRTLSLHKASLTSFLCSRMIIDHCKSKTDINDEQRDGFSPAQLSVIVDALVRHRFITPGPYHDFLHPVAVFGCCEQQLQSQAPRTEELAQILFPHLSLAEQATLKVAADRIRVFLRIQEKLPSLANYRVVFPAYRPGQLESVTSYQKQSEEIKQAIALEDAPLEISDLDLENTYVETISPEVFWHLKDVRNLNFSCNKSSSLSILSLIAQLRNLENLDLSHNSFTHLPPAFFEGLGNLRRINLENNLFPHEEIARIATICQEKEIILHI